jgi:hypothetical protein
MKSVFVESKRKSIASLQARYPLARIIDVTSKATDEFVKFSPFYPNKAIPVPFSAPMTSKSVEGIWQGLKVFEKMGVSTACFYNDTMKDLKRTVRKYGAPKGHAKGVDSKELLDYIAARKAIYLPSYLFVLEHRLQPQLQKLRQILEKQDIVLLDYETNGDVEDWRKPLSHAWLIKHYLDGNYPS